ncbi:YqgE/AlgH family protein [Fluviicola sp.]|uniref:YqgE/AlgH family protein n=1 Tax=Fluviicola sp. TaxID=1917219 RepID=UPI0031DF178E
MIPLKISKQPSPQRGDLLLSEPFLIDSNFSRVVILLCEHNDEGSFGLILNNTLEIEINELVTDFPEAKIPVGFGGPVERNQLFYVHRDASVSGSAIISAGLYLGGNYTEIKRMISENEMTPENLRFFIGYTGWSKGQLQSEIDELSWVVMKNPENFSVFSAVDDDLWRDLISQLGGKYKLMADYPLNPADN